MPYYVLNAYRKCDYYMIIYTQSVLELLKMCGYSQNYLLKQHIFSSGTLTKIRHGELVDLVTIDKICKLCNCTISDLIEYVPD